MTGAPIVDILLATYNGERYLAEQLESLLAQTFDDWRVLARDDGSTDSTTQILWRYAADYPERFTIIDDDDTGLGACGNFACLMECSTADYVMFCDQDDVWLPEKIGTFLAAMRDLEGQCGSDVPLLVHSDLKVVGSDLEPLHDSFWEYQSIDPSFGSSVNRLLIQNVVTGCASMCNRKSIEAALPVSAEAMMHDWWIALIAASFGRIEHIRDATVLYRQHGENAIGAKRFGVWMTLVRGIKSPVRAYYRSRSIVRATQHQAQAFLRVYGERMPDQLRHRICRFATLSMQGALERRLTLLRYRFLAKGLYRQLIFLVAV